MICIYNQPIVKVYEVKYQLQLIYKNRLENAAQETLKRICAEELLPCTIKAFSSHVNIDYNKYIAEDSKT